MQKLMIQMEDGKEVDLNEVLAKATADQLVEMGFTLSEGKADFSAFAAKSGDQVKSEKMDEAANFIKSIVLPAKMHNQYGVKANITTAGGSYGAAVPTELADVILEKKAKFAVMRSRAFSFTLSGNFDLPLEGTGVTGYWVGESDTADANLVGDSTPTITKKSLGDHYLAALVKVSWKLMDTSSVNIVNFVANLAARKLAEVEEAAFISGDGVGKPTGIRTETVTSVAQAAASLAYTDLVNLYFTLPAQYRANAVFITSAKGAKTIVSLKDTNNMPIFAPGQPLDELFRKPLIESSDIPENLGAGTNETEIWFGDPYYYWIKDGQELQIATDEVIERLQTKVLVYQAVDGKLTHAEAWAKMTAVK